MDQVRAVEAVESIKAHIDPTYQQIEEVIAPDVDQDAVAGLLGVEKPNGQERDKLAFIKDQFQYEDRADLLYQLREIERRLTPPRLGERRLDLVYNYLRVKQEAARAVELRDSYTDGFPR